MKKILFFSVAALALASCSNDEFLGENQTSKNDASGAIKFASTTNGMTRADHVGADAADLLGNNFVVMGTKGGTIGTPSSVVTTKVFDHYNVNWTQNTANTTASNTADWEYVGQTVHAYATANGITAQSIKYWDYSAGQYDFIAYSGGTADLVYDAAAANKLYVTEITPATATSATGGAYTVTGATADLGNFYIADLVTVPQANFGNEVSIKFRNLTSKVRVALYETVPGYSIRDVEFYESDAADVRYVAASPQPTSGTMENYFHQDGTPYTSSDNYDSNETYCVPESDVTTTATLYSQTANIYSDGTYTVYYPTVNNNTDSDNNKAHVSFAASTSGAATTSTYAALDYNNAKTLEGAVGSKTEKKYLGEASNNATYVDNSTTKPYTIVLPNESATALTLRVNYTLVSNDGSNETIKVWGAKAVVPAQYVQWKSNYAYTYLFKISDNTNGCTKGLGLGTAGLTPITFDAVVAETEDGLQETVTTVATPSITTYMKEAPNATANDEYPAGTIYVMVQDGATIKDLSSDGQLYTVTGATTNVPATEANVMDALNIRTSTGTGSPVVITGRNSLVLTEATSDATITAIPGVNGNDITVTAGQAASFTGATGKTYAYVYTVSTGTASTYNTAVTLTGASAPSDFTTAYYKDFRCTTLCVAGDYTDGDTYYQKLTNNNNVYAVKVIKVVS
ncbi:MAG: hypothetical protein KBT20_01405 [Bacteroidales bacterium]|nr:hypothetical protein [Candidatus Liminaster caballi]